MSRWEWCGTFEMHSYCALIPVQLQACFPGWGVLCMTLTFPTQAMSHDLLLFTSTHRSWGNLHKVHEIKPNNLHKAHKIKPVNILIWTGDGPERSPILGKKAIGSWWLLGERLTLLCRCAQTRVHVDSPDRNQVVIKKEKSSSYFFWSLWTLTNYIIL